MKTSSLILVVDDNDAGQLLVRTVLELEGFRVDSASSSEEVLERLNARKPDLILMDVQLPGKTDSRLPVNSKLILRRTRYPWWR